MPREGRARKGVGAVTEPRVPQDTARIYPCEKCGKMRTKAEGGTTFTVCDECWDKTMMEAERRTLRAVTNPDDGDHMTEPNQEPLYGHDTWSWDLEPDYSRHVAAMTVEDLHTKHEIASELAWRDQRIVNLTAECDRLRAFAESVRDSGPDYMRWDAIAALDKQP